MQKNIDAGNSNNMNKNLCISIKKYIEIYNLAYLFALSLSFSLDNIS